MGTKNIAIVCQGGGSHAAYAAGALQILLQELEAKREELRLIGLSGTSGGAICALLAWYGKLKGGPRRASLMLERFWQSNCANLPGEQAWNNSAIRAMDSLPYEILFSPYEWPTRASNTMLTQLWPAWSKWMEPFAWPAWKWMRGEYFQLDALIKPHINFELVACLGAYCSIPYNIERWNTARLEADMYGDAAAGAARKRKLEQKIRDGLLMPAKIRQLMQADDFPADAPLREALRTCPESVAEFETGTLRQLSVQVAQVMERIPNLLLGAVDVGNGEFTAFSSERAEEENGISLDAVMASAALPWLFEAVAIKKETLDGQEEDQQFWDGLFSQNPPIKNFVSGKDNARKPDEVWVVQINPVECDLKTLQEDIWDRRNELSGNLSLNQEVAFIRAINKRIDAASAAALPYPSANGEQADKHLQVHRIIMNGALIEAHTRKTLGSLSKADRSTALKDALMADGLRQAGNFVLMRNAMLSACDDLDSPIYAGLEPDSAAALTALRKLTAVARSTTAADATSSKVRLIIDETIMPPLWPKGEVMIKSKVKTPHQCQVRWHTRGVLNAVTEVNVEGETKFELSGNGQLAVRAVGIKITCIDQVLAATEAGLPQGLARGGQAAAQAGAGPH